MEQEINQLREQLQKQEKLASLGILSAGIAHEIQNPLNFVINFSKMSDKLLTISIIRGILLVSRGKENEYLPTDVCKLAKEYVWLSYHAMRANHKGFNVSIHEQYEEGMPQMMVIPQDLSRAILNIVNNALYSLWDKSQSAPDEYKPEITINVSKQDNNCIITITDNGKGMTDEVKQRLFENFFTTKPVGEGTGLGMNIVRDIIENKHHGKITFESEEGQGASFTFTIPITK